jgi:hypothetical protein
VVQDDEEEFRGAVPTPSMSSPVQDPTPATIVVIDEQSSHVATGQEMAQIDLIESPSQISPITYGGG